MMQVLKVTMAVLALLGSGSLQAQSPQLPLSEEMTVAAFMERVTELRRKGPEWPLSPEAGELLTVISTVGTAYRQGLRDREAAGQPVEACLPAETEIGSDVVLDHLSAYPAPAARETSIGDAFAQLVRSRFPCP